jgi:hypothetical protein
MYWSMGWYQNGAGYYNDNRLRTTNCFETFPNSVMGYWQSYSLTSIIRSDDALDQPKGYDAFSPDCNQGTNWSRSFGATYGAVREPGWSVIGETIYVNYTRGYSFVDCCYLGGGNSQWYMGPSVIICGHPFLRITDFSIEGVTP